MKRLLLIVAVCSLATAAYGQASKSKAKPAAKKGVIGKMANNTNKSNYGMAGCGLGSILFADSDSRPLQVLAATTNGTYSNGTFGISSGTSNCVPEKSARAAEIKKNVEIFVSANREALANDIVRSNGETIVAMSEIIGCGDTDYLGAKLQSRYESIFNSKEDFTVASNMFNTVSTDTYLIENCKL